VTTADHSPNIHPSDPRIAVPLYTMRQVSQFLAVPRSTLIRWHPFISHMEVSQRQQPNWPFIGLVEAYVLDVFRKAGVPFQRIRPALSDGVNTNHWVRTRFGVVKTLYRWGRNLV